MIQLIGPSQGTQRFFTYRGMIFGPFGPAHQYCEPITGWRSRTDGMVEAPGIFGENDVLHDKIIGTVTYNPAYVSASNTPYLSATYCYPDRVTMPTYNFGGAAAQVVANMGFAHDGAASMYYVKGGAQGTTYYHQFVEVLEYDRLNTIVWLFQGYAGSIQAAQKYVLGPITSRDSVYYHFDEVSSYFNLPFLKPSFDMVSRHTLGEFKSKVTGYAESAPKTTHLTSQWYKERDLKTPLCIPSVVKEATEVFHQQMSLSDFKIEMTDFGDLAMQASEKVNANRVNMIAFLRDLRHPTELIPKLKNLGKIKTHADNFLTVDYGILPTVDDLTSIVRACRGIKPYMDKNGFSTYTSATSTIKYEGVYTYELEQHLKLAIDDEDSGLDAIVERFESLGVFPTFENVWDLIPYSFVVDWFINVGDLLERIDSRMRLTRLNVRYVTMSYKQLTTKSLSYSELFPYTGDIQYGRYYRWVSDQCPTPPTSLHTTFDGFDHWIESAALLLQRRKS